MTACRTRLMAPAPGMSNKDGRGWVRISAVLAAPNASAPTINSGTNVANTGSTVETVTTALSPPLTVLDASGITFACAGLANIDWNAASAGPAARVSAATIIATRGNVSLVGRPRPAGRPVARAPATIQSTQAAVPATPMRPKKLPASNVDSMPTMRAPKTRPG